MKILTEEQFFFNNLGIPQDGSVSQLYTKYTKMIKDCFTSRFDQAKLDTLWEEAELTLNYFNGIGQMNLMKFLGEP